MFKEGDIVVYHLPEPVYLQGMLAPQVLVSACKYDPNHPSGWGWEFIRPTMGEINGITAMVGYVDYTEYPYYSGWGYIHSGNYEIAVNVTELTHYSGIANPAAFKRSW